MRVIKKADERKNEILDAANELFSEKGFDGTSTNDILEKVGIARGTLYHHFKSKESIMDALIDRTSDMMLINAEKIAYDETIPVYERILKAILALNIQEGESSDNQMIEHMHNPQNALMHQKIHAKVIQEVTPILTKIVNDGIEQNLIDTPFPYETVEMILVYSNTIFDEAIIVATEKKQQKRIEAFAYNIERLFGIKTGELSIYILKIFE